MSNKLTNKKHSKYIDKSKIKLDLDSLHFERKNLQYVPEEFRAGSVFLSIHDVHELQDSATKTRLYERIIEEFAEQHGNLLVFPGGSLNNIDGKVSDNLIEHFRNFIVGHFGNKNLAVCFGIDFEDGSSYKLRWAENSSVERSSQKRKYQSIVVITSQGEVNQVFKIHLTGNEKDETNKGTKPRRVVTFNGRSIATGICNDLFRLGKKDIINFDSNEIDLIVNAAHKTPGFKKRKNLVGRWKQHAFKPTYKRLKAPVICSMNYSPPWRGKFLWEYPENGKAIKELGTCRIFVKNNEPEIGLINFFTIK